MNKLIQTLTIAFTLSIHSSLAVDFGLMSVKGVARDKTVEAGAEYDRVFAQLSNIKLGGKYSYKWAGHGKKTEWVSGLGLKTLSVDRSWVVTFGVLPCWLTQPKCNKKELGSHYYYPPSNWDEFEALIKWTTSYLGENVKIVEVINEPDSSKGWKGSIEDLVKYHKVAAKAIHSVRPEIKVAGPTLTRLTDNRIYNWLDAFVRLNAFNETKTGMKDKLDAISIHPYVNNGKGELYPEGEQFLLQIKILKQYLFDNQLSEIPLYFTEFGWSGSDGRINGPFPPNVIANYYSRALIIAAAESINLVMPFCTKSRNGNGFSMIDNDLIPRPSYFAYKNTVQHLKGTESGKLYTSINGNMFVAVFDIDTSLEKLLVAWTVDTDVDFPISSDYIFSVTNLYGKHVNIRNERLLISHEPMFIYGDSLLIDEVILNLEYVY